MFATLPGGSHQKRISCMALAPSARVGSVAIATQPTLNNFAAPLDMGSRALASSRVGNLRADWEFPMCSHTEERHAQTNPRVDSHFFGTDGIDCVDGRRRAGRRP